MKPPSTDFQLLRAIYERHRDDYLTFVEKGGQTRIDVPIDIPAIAQDLGVDANSVFGRLYHHLDPIYGTQNEDGSRKALFMAQPGSTNDRINFPLLEAALAGLWQQRRRDSMVWGGTPRDNAIYVSRSRSTDGLRQEHDEQGDE